MYRFPRNDQLSDDRLGPLDYRDIQAEEEHRSASGRWPLLQATDRILRWQDRYPDRGVRLAPRPDSVSDGRQPGAAAEPEARAAAPSQELSVVSLSATDSLVARPA